MHRDHMTEVKASLQGLADVYGKPHPTTAALVHWWEALKEFRTEDVLGMLADWAKFSRSMPTPHDVWEKLNVRRTDALEQKAALERASNRAAVTPDFHPTPLGREMLRLIHEMLSKPRKLRGGKVAWAKWIIDLEASGEPIPYYPMKMARDILKAVPVEL
jgi:hypothetical protein